MSRMASIFVAGMLATTMNPISAAAQDAAESAAILSGSSQTGAAQRSLGARISGAINRASDSIAAQQGARVQAQRPNRGGAVRVVHSLPAGVDVLEGTDATTYRLGNGSSIRTTGRINGDPGLRCVSNCEKARQP